MSLGAGLLVERLAGTRLPDRLLLPCGFALLVLAGALALSWDPSARLTAPLLVVVALAGFAVPLAGRRRWIGPGALWPALVVFLLYGAPVLALGEPTFLGFGKLDDPATFFTLIDRVTAHGHDLSELPRSSYRQTLSLFFGQGYPLGVFAPLHTGSRIVAQDPMWVFQPYIAFLAAMLALVLAEVGKTVAGARMAVFAACGASLSALLYGYAMWGGVKELCGAMLIALGAALVPIAAAEWRRGGGGVPPAGAGGGLVGGPAAGGPVWGAPLAAGRLGGGAPRGRRP